MQSTPKPEYARAKQHLADPRNQEFWPRNDKETRAVAVVKSQQRYTQWKKDDAAKRRAVLAEVSK